VELRAPRPRRTSRSNADALPPAWEEEIRDFWLVFLEHGISVEARVKLGPVTLLAMTQTADGNLKLLAAEGESVAGAMLQIGNTNSRIRFKQGMRNFVDRRCMEGPTHHCALGGGPILPVVRRMAALLNRPCAEME